MSAARGAAGIAPPTGSDSATRETGQHVAAVDGLRAVAVAAVMLFHLLPQALPGGFTGVDVFFVISGYVVTASLANRPPAGLGRYTLAFYARRVLRILPALLGCLLTTAVLTTLFVPDAWLSQATRQVGLWAFFGLSNHALLWHTDGYFSPRAEFNPFVHTWSLAVEEQFYVVFPLVFFLWLQRGSARPALAWLGRHGTLALWCASLAWCAWASAARPDEAFYLLPSRFWELATGALLLQWQRAGVLARWPGLGRHGALGGAVLMLAGLAVVSHQPFPFPQALLPVLGTAWLIHGLTHGAPLAATGRPVQAVLSHPATVAVGRLSYSLYLWHWPVYVLLRWTTGLASPATLALALAATVALATLSYHAVEVPLRRHPRVLALPQWLIVAAALLAVALAWQLAREVFHLRHRIGSVVNREATLWYPSAWAPPAGSARVCTAQEGWRELPGATVLELGSADCRARGVPTQLFVIGDSHAGAYTTLLRQWADASGMAVRQYGRSGCSFANFFKPTPADDVRCLAFAEAAMADVERLARPGDIVLLAALRMPRIGGQDRRYELDALLAEQRGPAAAAQRAAAERQALAQVARLRQRGLKLVLEAPKPVHLSPPFRCADWFNRGNPVCAPGFEVPRDTLMTLRAPVQAALERAAQQPNTWLWDPFDVLCPGARCQAFDGQGRPLFFDGDHLSAHANRLLFPGFAGMMAAVLRDERPAR